MEKVLVRCKETNLSLSHEKCFMMFTEGIVLGHHISGDGIKVDRSKVEVISKLPIPNFPKLLQMYYHKLWNRPCIPLHNHESDLKRFLVQPFEM